MSPATDTPSAAFRHWASQRDSDPIWAGTEPSSSYLDSFWFVSAAKAEVQAVMPSNIQDPMHVCGDAVPTVGSRFGLSVWQPSSRSMSTVIRRIGKGLPCAKASCSVCKNRLPPWFFV